MGVLYMFQATTQETGQEPYSTFPYFLLQLLQYHVFFNTFLIYQNVSYNIMFLRIKNIMKSYMILNKISIPLLMFYVRLLYNNIMDNQEKYYIF